MFYKNPGFLSIDLRHHCHTPYYHRKDRRGIKSYDEKSLNQEKSWRHTYLSTDYICDDLNFISSIHWEKFILDRTSEHSVTPQYRNEVKISVLLHCAFSGLLTEMWRKWKWPSLSNRTVKKILYVARYAERKRCSSS